MDRSPAAWETGAAGPFLWIGDVTVWVTPGDQRFRIESPAGVEAIEGFEQASARAREPAGP